MNNEIKEIIEYFKDDIDFLEVELKHPEFKGRYITIRDKECEYLRKLLDYITNLQEEKDSLDDYNRHLHNELKDYKSRNDKAIEYIKLWHYRNDFRVNSFTKGVKEELLDILKGSDKE